MSNAANGARILSAEYGQALANLDRTNPHVAAVIRQYTTALRSEAAAYRRQAHRLRCELEAVQR